MTTSSENQTIYDVERETILASLQILPPNESGARHVLLSLGIKGEIPLIRTLTLEQLQSPVLLQLLGELKAQRQETKARAQKQQQRREKLNQAKTTTHREPIAIQTSLF